MKKQNTKNKTQNIKHKSKQNKTKRKITKNQTKPKHIVHNLRDFFKKKIRCNYGDKRCKVTGQLMELGNQVEGDQVEGEKTTSKPN